MDISSAIHVLLSNKSLQEDELTRLFQSIFRAGATPAQIASVFTFYRLTEPTYELWKPIIHVLQHFRAPPLPAPADTLLVASLTGSKRSKPDAHTASLFLMAAGGMRVFSYGNRTQIGHPSAADFLEALGIHATAPIEKMMQTLAEIGIGFAVVPHFFTPMKHLLPIMHEIDVPTPVDKLLPFALPFIPRFALLDAATRAEALLVAELLKEYGTKHAWLGYPTEEGFAFSPSHKTAIVSLRDGLISEIMLDPLEAGLPRFSPIKDDQRNRASSPEYFKNLLSHKLRQDIPFRQEILLRAAAANVVLGRSTSLRESTQLLKETLASSKLSDKMYAYANITSQIE